MKKHVVIIGAKGSGKSSVANWLNGTKKPLKKCQDAIYGDYTLDIPSGYLENPSMYRYIFSLAQTAGVVLLLVNGEEQGGVFPPHFAKSFSCPVVGIYRSANEGECQRAWEILKEAGVKEPYEKLADNDQEMVKLRQTLLSLL